MKGRKIEGKDSYGGKGAMNLWKRIMDINNRISYLQDKLSDMRSRYVRGSPAMKMFLTSGAKLLKKELERLKKTTENEKNGQLKI